MWPPRPPSCRLVLLRDQSYWRPPGTFHPEVQPRAIFSSLHTCRWAATPPTPFKMLLLHPVQGCGVARGS